MTPDDARRILGVAEGASAPQLRRAYRALVREHHPDRSGGTAVAHLQTIQIIEAYRVLTDNGDGPATTDGAGGPRRTGRRVGVSSDGGSLLVRLPADQAFLLLLNVAYRYGEVTYLDADAGLFETVLEFDGHGACALLVTLQGRTRWTEAFCTCEPLGDPARAPAGEDVVQWLAAAVKDELSATT